MTLSKISYKKSFQAKADSAVASHEQASQNLLLILDPIVTKMLNSNEIYFESNKLTALISDETQVAHPPMRCCKLVGCEIF